MRERSPCVSHEPLPIRSRISAARRQARGLAAAHVGGCYLAETVCVLDTTDVRDRQTHRGRPISDLDGAHPTIVTRQLFIWELIAYMIACVRTASSGEGGAVREEERSPFEEERQGLV
jgi:hypothetical protein